MSPVAPFFSDWLYKNLSDPVRKASGMEGGHISVHLTDLSVASEDLIDSELEQRMDYAQRISSLVLSLRKKENLRVRQPLKRIMLPEVDADFKRRVEEVRDLILSEVNVKDIEFIADAEGLLKKKAKPNFKTLGRRLGKHMKGAAQIIAQLDQKQIAEIEKNNAFELVVDGENYDLTLEDFEILTEDIPGWQVATDGPLLVALDITLDDELLAEGYARDLVNRIQNLRKSNDLNVTDRIKVAVQSNEDIDAAVLKFGEYIKGETLADALDTGADVKGEEVEWVDGGTVVLSVEKV
jgi:isoleucyl-tRNA synthetase